MKKFDSSLASIVLFLISINSFAAPIAAVGTQSCNKMLNRHHPFILVLKKGENVVDSILRCANEANLASASISGLGTVKDPTLAFFDIKKNEYKKQKFSGFYELLSLDGNIVREEDGTRTANIHAALGDDQYKTLGGHLIKATAGATVEVTITPLNAIILKKVDPKTGLKTISTDD